MRPPRIKLSDVYGLREQSDSEHAGCPGVISWANFDLADDQTMGVGLTEPVYVMRDGKATAVSNGYVEVQLVQNEVRYLKSATTVTKEIDFGPDCRENLVEMLNNTP